MSRIRNYTTEIHVQLSKEDKQRLDALVKRLGKFKTEIVRMGIREMEKKTKGEGDVKWP